MPSNKNHIHTFRRHIAKTGTKFYFCTDDTCTFKIQTKLAVGKLTKCNLCGEPFKLTPYSIQLAKPHCPNCNNKQGRGVRKNREIPLMVDDTSELRDRLLSIGSKKLEYQEDSLNSLSIEDDGDI